MSENKITFTSADTGLSSFKFILEPAENNGKTIFAPDDRARLKLYPGGQNPQIGTTWGTASVFQKSMKQTFTEYIAFRNSDSGNTAYYIEKLISASWEGKGEGRPLIYGSRVILPNSTTGVLKVQYETSYDLIDVTCSHPTYLLISAESDTLSGDFLVDFTNGYLTDIFDKDVVMTVRGRMFKGDFAQCGSLYQRQIHRAHRRRRTHQAGQYEIRHIRPAYNP